MKSHALSRMLSKKMVFVLLCWAVDCTKQANVRPKYSVASRFILRKDWITSDSQGTTLQILQGHERRFRVEVWFVTGLAVVEDSFLSVFNADVVNA